MMDELNECTICRAHAKCESGFSPLESTEYAYCSNEDCIFHLIENNWFTRDEWNFVNKPALTPMQKAAPEMYEMLKSIKMHSEMCYSHADVGGEIISIIDDIGELLAKAIGEQ